MSIAARVRTLAQKPKAQIVYGDVKGMRHI